jgi:lipoprotein-anchoring transpeptidase ErfK/SrfK
MGAILVLMRGLAAPDDVSMRRTTTILLTLLALAVPAGAAASPVPPRQELAVLLRDASARAAPAPDAQQVALVHVYRPLAGTPTRLPVIERATVAGRLWLHVRLPGRQRHGRVLASSGWIPAAGTAHAVTRWHIVVRTHTRRALVYRDGRLRLAVPVVVGKPSTPTPRGEFFVEETVRLVPGSAGGPYALATSARSSVLQEFAGGPGQVALHGVANLPGRLGSAASHGCVRLSTWAIGWVAARIGAGVPITIR